MKGACNACGKVRQDLRKVDTVEGKRFLCRACRRDLKRPVGSAGPPVGTLAESNGAGGAGAAGA